jgi:hypothetical protein
MITCPEIRTEQMAALCGLLLRFGGTERRI